MRETAVIEMPGQEPPRVVTRGNPLAFMSFAIGTIGLVFCLAPSNYSIPFKPKPSAGDVQKLLAISLLCFAMGWGSVKKQLIVPKIAVIMPSCVEEQPVESSHIIACGRALVILPLAFYASILFVMGAIGLISCFVPSDPTASKPTSGNDIKDLARISLTFLTMGWSLYQCAKWVNKPLKTWQCRDLLCGRDPRDQEDPVATAALPRTLR